MRTVSLSNVLAFQAERCPRGALMVVSEPFGSVATDDGLDVRIYSARAA